ncbi:hypothetical protein BDZ94DRAFT_1032906 [Collybia nuda]|uniref:Uncharacterized protein n=1 Tax=Collybia nuda TaxID=64659 RepID=A0A9P5YCB1_9AGAR|nr:hypothetical protein BDZ94DRAFT_1032906 [Collybia nuda]
MIPLSFFFALFFIVPLTSVVTIVAWESDYVQTLKGSEAAVILFLRSAKIVPLIEGPAKLNILIPSVPNSRDIRSWVESQILRLGGNSQRQNNLTAYVVFKEASLVILNRTKIFSVGPIHGLVIVLLVSSTLLAIIPLALASLQQYLLTRNTPNNITLPLSPFQPTPKENKNEHENLTSLIHNKPLDLVCVRCTMRPIISSGPPINSILSTIPPWPSPQNPSNAFELMAIILHQRPQNMYSETPDPFGFSEQIPNNTTASEDLTGNDDLDFEDPLETWTRWMVTIFEPELHIPPLQSTTPLAQSYIPPLKPTSPLTLQSPFMSATVSQVPGDF